MQFMAKAALAKALLRDILSIVSLSENKQSEHLMLMRQMEL